MRWVQTYRSSSASLRLLVLRRTDEEDCHWLTRMLYECSASEGMVNIIGGDTRKKLSELCEGPTRRLPTAAAIENRMAHSAA